MARFAKRDSRRVRLARLGATLTLLLAAGTAAGAATPEQQRLFAARQAETYTVDVPDSPVDIGGARIGVGASLATTRGVVTDFDHYAEFVRRFSSAKIVATGPEGTDVRLELPVMKGWVTLWALVRFAPPSRDAAGVETIRGKLLDGNVSAFDATWRLTPLSATATQADLELRIVPKLPVPGELVTAETRRAASVGVTAARDRAESLDRERAAK